MNFKLSLVAFFLVCQGATYSQISLFSFGSTWKYKDDGSNQGTGWQAAAFDDSGWASGVGQLGFGDGDESTVLTSGSVTYYFRKSVIIADISQFQSFTIEMFRDDGVVIYVNGVEVVRDNMNSGTVNFNTLALFASDDGQTKLSYTIPTTQFQSGVNVIAVEVHQESVGSSDISWDMKLTGLPPTITSFFTLGSTWKYLDDGSDQGTLWSDASFNDSGWQSGSGRFGFPQSNVTTLLNACGTLVPNPTCTNKYITYYFRKTVNIPSVSVYQSFTFQFNRDDGIIIYVNGVEVVRNNIAAGTVNYLTLANNALDNGNSLVEKSVPASAFSDGDNTIAVEIHQTSASSSDLIFDMSLLGIKPGNVGLVLGPYLQKATSTSMVVRWRTSDVADSKVQYGTSSNDLSLTATESNLSTTDHIVELTGLTPSTKYFYNVGTSNVILEEDESNYFLTSPLAGTTGKYSFWAIGDAGDNSSNQLNVRDSYYTYIGSNTTNGWLLLGDNAYENGLDDEYRDNFFKIYESNIARKAPIWPVPGNHEYANTSSRQKDQAIAYFDYFSPPTGGEAGGVASGSKAYYSFDYGNIHFIALDSYIIENNLYRLYDAAGPQFQWLQADLAANTKEWIIVYFHHPPYSMGSHNSDTENELIKIRQNVNPLLEQYNVDLVMSGHSHNYERSRMMKGYFGFESAFNAATYNLSQSSGTYQDASSCPYVKDASNNGTVYVVAGSAGELEAAQVSYPHDAMYFSTNSIAGSFLFSVEENRLDAKWLASNGTVMDKFTILKNVNKVTNLSTDLSASVTLNASWVGNYAWSSSETTRSITLPPATSGTYTVTDSYGCITDVFNITTTPLPVKLIAFTAKVLDDEVHLNWKTASEINNDFFEVQRFNTGPEEITILGKVNGHGTTAELHTYQFIDKSPIDGISYYRLKQVDYDGKCEYSNLVSTQFQGSKVIELFPNPGNGIQLGLSVGEETGPAYVSVQDARGVNVATFSTDIVPSSVQLIKFDAPLSPGLYFIHVKSNKGISAFKWMVK